MASRPFPHPSAAPEMDARWLILADDLTGAADCAVAFRRRGNAAAVIWGEAVQDERIPILSYDADSRGLTAEAAAQRHAALLGRLHSADRRLFKKIDSTMRGQPPPRSPRRSRSCAPVRPGLRRAGAGFPGTADPRWRAGAGGAVARWRRRRCGGATIATPAPISARYWPRPISVTTLTLPIVRGGTRRRAGRGRGRSRRDRRLRCRNRRRSGPHRRGRPRRDGVGRLHRQRRAGARARGGRPVAALAPVRIAPDRRGSLLVVGSLAEVSRAGPAPPGDGAVAHLPVAPRRCSKRWRAGRTWRRPSRNGWPPARTSWSRSCWGANPT